MGNVTKKSFYVSGATWTAPAGVTQVTVQPWVGPIIPHNIGANGTHSLAIDSTGVAYAWGGNGTGQLGLNDVVSRSSPVPVVGGLKFKQIGASGSANSAGLDFGGKAYCWGDNTYGQLGDGTVVAKSSPVPVLGGLFFKKIANQGSLFCIGLAYDGKAYGWGYNGVGGLGVNDIVHRSSPVLVVGGLTFKDIATSDGYTLGLATDGTLYAWGFNISGQLGDGTVTNRSSPVPVLGGLKFEQIAAANRASYALTSDGTLYAWGLNANGQLGLGDVTPRSSPVAVLGGLKFKQISAGVGGTITAITVNGTAYSWGYNANGQVGDGTVTPRSSPVLVVGGLSFNKVSCGGLGAGGVDLNGKLYAWGLNSSGQLGDGTVVDKSSPVLVLGGIAWKQIGNSTLAAVTLQVVPGTTYTITLNDVCSYLGAMAIGPAYALDLYYDT